MAGEKLWNMYFWNNQIILKHSEQDVSYFIDLLLDAKSSKYEAENICSSEETEKKIWVKSVIHTSLVTSILVRPSEFSFEEIKLCHFLILHF